MTTINNPFKIKPGTIATWPNIQIPAGWLVCDGSAISRTTYKALFAAIGTTYGAGDGTTNFNIPNGKIPLGNTVSVIGNGMTLGLLGSVGNTPTNFGLTYNPNQYIGMNMAQSAYGKPVEHNADTGGTSPMQSVGITTDAEKSGIVASLSNSDVETKTIIKY